MPPSPLALTLHDRIAEIPAGDWQACAGSDNPFLSHGFLSAIEDSGSATAATGWLPRHIALRNEQGVLAAVAPLYVKNHSYGEYVFDQGWADAFERAGGKYYPKLQVAVPFSPVPGPRLLRRPESDIGIETLGDTLIEICRRYQLSSAHVTFCSEAEWQALGKTGWLQRLGMQFHWHNEGYENFDAFLEKLSSRHRKSIRRERLAANSCGLDFKTLHGGEIKANDWDAFYRFYQSTIDRKWGTAYLTRKFFTLLSERLGNQVILMLAAHDGAPVAGALNLQGSDTLYGRNWGCVGDWPFLHFELCYYRAIDYAIANGLRRVEAGAQGAHKIKRGYLPQPTYSAHWIAHPGLAKAVKSFVAEESRAVQAEMQELADLSPFRRDAA